MNAFPETLKFCYPWRPYQARVLSELATHLDDNHLHIVAAPGSGKTVLGLEVTRRLNRPALIMAPTVAIRDQWVDRLAGMFCGGEVPTWVSRDVREPGFLTVTTYQGLFSALHVRNDKQGHARQRLLKTLAAQHIGTLVLDEAHHLRKAWWKSLIAVKTHLQEPTVVALTATAPFDVSPFEWDRYVELCGPIDAEIAVPELVREGNLCPHQDLVYLSAPLQSESEEIRSYRAAIEAYLQELGQNQELLQALSQQPQVTHAQDHLETILEDPAFYTAVGVFLKEKTGRAPKRLFRSIGVSRRHCPKLDHTLLERLLNGILYTQRKALVLPEALTRRLEKDLARLGAADKRQVELDNPRKVAGRLLTSASKLASIGAIVEWEQGALGEDLRLVILTDYIRRTDFPLHAEDLQPIKCLGVVPIFEWLRRQNLPHLRLGILSGSLVVIPTDSLDSLRLLAERLHIAAERIKSKPLVFDDRFCEVQVIGAEAHRLVHLVTELFNQGRVTALVGTTSLLGEGWDAPSVNTLILASFVGSFMLSNQMRGRAIRTQSEKPEKTANIWHLVCQEMDRTKVGPDLDLMKRRFEAFSGVSLAFPIISSGMDRLGLGSPPYTRDRVEEINGTMHAYAQDRARLRERWLTALERAREAAMVETLATGTVLLPRRFVLVNTILALLWQAWCTGGFYFLYSLQAVEDRFVGLGARSAVILLLILCALAALLALPWCLKALWLFLWHAPVASSVKQIAKAVLGTLVAADAIETRPAHIKVVTRREGAGAVSCTLKGVTTRERSVFLEALQEILGPIENPRYLLARKTPLLRWFRKDYHGVPRLLGRKKELAETFRDLWSKYVGPTELIYTRSEKGRRRLLHARGHSLAQAFTRYTERLRTWE